MSDLKWKKFPILNDGFVCLVDSMGNDASIVRAARTSFAKDIRSERDEMPKDDVNLLRYLMRHRHSTPFEMAELVFLVRVPMDCWRQWIRHRTASVNEYSTRYVEAIDSRQTTPADAWRLQSQSNKQGSSGEFVTEWPEATDLLNSVSPGEYLSIRERDLHKMAHDVYNERLVFGVAKEVARKDLPLSTYTEAYWKLNLHNLFHFLGLRMDLHAQSEIRSYATVIGEQIVAQLFPVAWQAFRDYRLEAMTLSRLDIEVLNRISEHIVKNGIGPYMGNTSTVWPEEWRQERSRERDECKAKLSRLGFV